MTVFRYDKSFEGLLTVVFDAYARRQFPELLLAEGDPLPLFYDEVMTIHTDGARADRVWNGLRERISRAALSMLMVAWLSELPKIDSLLFRYIRKAIDAPQSIELNFGDPDVLAVAQIAKKVGTESHRVTQFIRFQKAADGTFFAAVRPVYNVLPLTLPHLTDRFADQRWLVYDIGRAYGYYYDLKEATEVRFAEQETHLFSGRLDDGRMAADERLFQQLWKTYFHATAIRERFNPCLHRQNMPARFWKFMPEKW